MGGSYKQWAFFALNPTLEKKHLPKDRRTTRLQTKRFVEESVGGQGSQAKRLQNTGMTPKPWQVNVMLDAVYTQKNVDASAGTGSGKSLPYQLIPLVKANAIVAFKLSALLIFQEGQNTTKGFRARGGKDYRVLYTERGAATVRTRPASPDEREDKRLQDQRREASFDQGDTRENF